MYEFLLTRYGQMVNEMNNRQEILNALATLPDPVWVVYLRLLRVLNAIFAESIIDDPTPCIAIEEAIEKELGKL